MLYFQKKNSISSYCINRTRSGGPILKIASTSMCLEKIIKTCICLIHQSPCKVPYILPKKHRWRCKARDENPEAGPRRVSLALQRQLKKFTVRIIIFVILVRFRAEFYDLSNFQIQLFFKAFRTSFDHFLMIWNVLSLYFMTKDHHWNFQFSVMCYKFQKCL